MVTRELMITDVFIELFLEVMLLGTVYAVPPMVYIK